MKRLGHIISCVTATLFICISILPCYAETVTIDFEKFTAMTFWAGNPVPPAAQLSDQLLPTHGLRFSSDSQPYVAVVSLGTWHARSGTNGIGGVNAANFLSYSNAIRIEFFVPAVPATKATTDFVSISGDALPDSGWVHLDAFGSDGALLATDIQSEGPPVTLSVRAPGIHSVLITQESGQVAFDDFAFTSPLTPVSPLLTIEVSQVRLCWKSDTNTLYQVQYRSELTANQWTDFGAPVQGNGTVSCLTDAVTGPPRFYRMVVLP